MPIKVKIFGDLKNKIPQQEDSTGAPIILSLNHGDIERVKNIVEKLSLNESEISHIFVNNKYSGFNKSVKAGDTVALFPKNMGLLYKWYYPVDNE